MTRTIGGTKGFNDFLILSEGISRTRLNIFCFTSMFVLGLLYKAVFSMLGSRIGYLYVVLLFAVALMFVFEPVSELRMPLSVYYIIHLVGWVHANIILSRIKGQARYRLKELNNLKQITTDVLLEKGIILHKALRENEESIEVLKEAIQMVDGDSYLLYIAGVLMVNNKRFEDAVKLFDRATEQSTDKELLNIVEYYRRRAEKKMGRN